MAPDAAAMTAVAAQPKTRVSGRSENRPMTERRDATTIIAAMIGTAAMPLTTALQNKALIGSIGDQSSSTPTKVAPAMIA